MRGQRVLVVLPVVRDPAWPVLTLGLHRLCCWWCSQSLWQAWPTLQRVHQRVNAGLGDEEHAGLLARQLLHSCAQLRVRAFHQNSLEQEQS